MSRISIAFASIAVALVLVAPAAPAPAPIKLAANVGPGFTISLKNAAGKRVTTLKRGRYAFVVTDQSDFHSFRLKGPKLNRELTGVAFKGKKTITIQLKPGRYTFNCDPHASTMKGAFRVT